MPDKRVRPPGRAAPAVAVTHRGPQELLADLRAGGVRDPGVLAAFEAVDRADFVPAELRAHAYEDRPLPIGDGQTISQPLIVGLMIQALELQRTDRVLEVGTGSGYATALLAELAAEVYSIENRASLAASAADRLRSLGYLETANVDAGCRRGVLHLALGDGSVGWAQGALFDAIMVSATGPHLPEPLLAQLGPSGRLVMPVGTDRQRQRLVRVGRGPDGLCEEADLGWVRFVPLLGQAGWPDRTETQPL